MGVVVFTPFVISVSANLALPTPVGCVWGLGGGGGGGGGTEIHSSFVNYGGNQQTRLATLERRHTETTKTRRTLRASLSGTLLQTLPDLVTATLYLRAAVQRRGQRPAKRSGINMTVEAT